MANISVRRSIRWLPEDASEPTSTIVLTSPGRHFVDVRILVSHPHVDVGANERLALLPLHGLDWAFAGTSTHQPKPDGTAHSQWRHWIDSRTLDPDSVIDQGDMYQQKGGTTLETGTMVNPATGIETDYEEVWKDVKPQSTGRDQSVRCVVLQTISDDHSRVRGKAILLGQFCQCILRTDDTNIFVERWQFDRDAGWKRMAKFGQAGDSACEELIKKTTWEVGQEVSISNISWHVVESHQLSDCAVGK